MAEFVWKPLDEEDVDIHSDPDAEVSAHLGVRKALFGPKKETELITSGEEIDKANEVIEIIRPYIKADGGDVSILGIKDGWLQLKMLGECGSCAVSASTLLEIEQSICEEIPTIKGVEAVQED